MEARSTPRRARFALGLLGIVLVSIVPSSALAGASMQNSCGSCQSAPAAIIVDPVSYKLWPSGARTFANVQWGTYAGSASFSLLNSGSAPTSPFTATVQVNDYDPLSQIPMDGISYSYSIPALTPGQTATVTVPLNPAQCDIFVTVNAGAGPPTVLRTGNPAAC
jgi:hypothetical protein